MCDCMNACTTDNSSYNLLVSISTAVQLWGPTDKISHSLSLDYVKFIARLTYDGDFNVLKFLSGIS